MNLNTDPAMPTTKSKHVVLCTIEHGERNTAVNLRTACPPSWNRIRRAHWLWALSLILVFPLLAACGTAFNGADNQPLQHFERTEPHMGTQFRISLYAVDQRQAEVGFKVAFARVGQLDSLLSDYKSESEINRLCAAGPGRSHKVSIDLWQVLSHAQTLSRLSRGAFDVTVGPYTKLWRRARRSHEFPESQRLTAAKSAVGFEKIVLFPGQHKVELKSANMRLDLGGIAKGYAVDQALTELKRIGIKHALVDGGGDLAVSDPPPNAEYWKVGVAPLREGAPPSVTLRLENNAVATSGDLWRFTEIDGTRYSHIVDPRTGIGLTKSSNVCVIARDCTTADSLASAISVMGVNGGQRMIASIDGAEMQFLSVDETPAESQKSRTNGGEDRNTVETNVGVQQIRSSGFAKFVMKRSEG